MWVHRDIQDLVQSKAWSLIRAVTPVPDKESVRSPCENGDPYLQQFCWARKPQPGVSGMSGHKSRLSGISACTGKRRVPDPLFFAKQSDCDNSLSLKATLSHLTASGAFWQ